MIAVLFRQIFRSIHSLHRLSFQVIESFMTPKALEIRYLSQIANCAQQRRLDEAFHLAQKGIDINAKNYFFYEVRGLYYHMQWEFDKAIENYSKAITLCPDDPELYGDLYRSRGKVWKLLQEHERAIADFDIAIAATPNFEAHSSRGYAYFDLGRYEEALSDYNEALNFRPDSDTYTAQSKAFIQLQKYADASIALNKATRLDPDNYEAYLVLGNIYQYEENYKSAIETYDKAISLITEDRLGNEVESIPVGIQFKHDVYEEVIRHLVEAFTNRSYCQVRIENNTKALADIDDAVELLPESATLYVVRSFINLKIGDHNRALNDLAIAIEHDNNNSEAFFARANVHANQKAYKEAIEDIDRAIDLSRESGLFHLERGRLLLHVEQYELAISDFDKVIELELSTSQKVVRDGLTLSITQQGLDAHTKYMYRALSYLLLGNREMARRDLLNAKDLGLTQIEIEEEITELFSDKIDRHSVLDFVKRIFADRRHGVVDKEEQYIDLFRELGFYDINTGKTLKHRKSIPSIYFNSRYGTVFFVVYAKDKHRFHSSLWKQIPPQRRKDAKPKFLTVVPRDGKEREAFKQLL